MELRIRNLSKTYANGVVALDRVTLTIPAGMFGLLGPNGAGKSTLVRAVATLLVPDGGTLTVAGIDAARHPEQVRRIIGLAGQHAAVEPALTGRENLVMVARLFGHGRSAARVAAECNVRRLVLTHIPPWNDPEPTRAEAAELWPDVELAHSGARYSLSR